MTSCILVGGEEQSKGMLFLKENMPPSDKSNPKLQQLIENNVKYAYKAREEFEWARTIPEEIFLNDVLPYALLDERRDDWRKDFYTRFSKIVVSAKSQKEAILLINHAILKELDVEYSTKRNKANQSPYESIEINKASCTGLSILLANAFRSVGIPARIAGTPAWTTKNGNHNWVEVWLLDEQQWQFTEYHPDAKGLGHAWFVNDAAKADPSRPMHRIYASSWRKTGTHFPLVWNMKKKSVPAIDVTQNYLKEAAQPQHELRIEALSAGKRVDIPVYIYVKGVLKSSGQTPSTTLDANAFLTFEFDEAEKVELRWSDLTGAKKSKLISISDAVHRYTINL